MKKSSSILVRIVKFIAIVFYGFFALGCIALNNPMGCIISIMAMLWNTPLRDRILKGRQEKRGVAVIIALGFFLSSMITFVAFSEVDSTAVNEKVDQEMVGECNKAIEEGMPKEDINYLALSQVAVETDSNVEEKISSNTGISDKETQTIIPSNKEIPLTSGITEKLSVKDIMEVHYIDVGQGDATLIKCGNEAMLIDAGDGDHGSSVRLYMKKQGISELKYLLLTHSDADHIGGAASVITNVPIDTVFMCRYEKDNHTYDNLLNALFYKNLSWSTPDVGDIYTLGDAKFTVIAPNGIYSDPNNSSIAIILHHGNNGFLFTGDAEIEAENDIVKNGIDIDCDVYQAGHHGSYTASSKVLLDAAKPKYTVISCAIDNSYGHPHEDSLSRIKESGSELFRIDKQGSIIATSDGKSISFDVKPINDWTCGSAEKKKSASTQYKEQLASEADISIQSSQEEIVAPEPVLGTTYVCNRNTFKFHYPDCSSVGDMSPKNRWDVTLTREEVIAQGFVPCKRCNP